MVTEVATRALKAVWYQKWRVHRRLRPEALGGLIHRRLTDDSVSYPIHQEILDKVNNGEILARIKEHNKNQNTKFGRGDTDGTYLLSQGFREGSPTHPTYGAGHATVAGACVTILKAWFNENEKIKKPMIPSILNSPTEVEDSYSKTTELQPYTNCELYVGK